MVRILGFLFLKEVKTGYYDFRKVSIDLVISFNEEQCFELVPELVEKVNGFTLFAYKQVISIPSQVNAQIIQSGGCLDLEVIAYFHQKFPSLFTAG
jgi:hypothetical protein